MSDELTLRLITVLERIEKRLPEPEIKVKRIRKNQTEKLNLENT